MSPETTILTGLLLKTAPWAAAAAFALAGSPRLGIKTGQHY